jgi:hypothetical protein
MSRGGARNRSGPMPTEGSASAERRGYKLTALPAEGYQGEVPDFPLPDPSDREFAVWDETWRTPQACAWSLPSEQWRIRTVAMWVRQSVRCEAPDAPANQLAQLHRFADQIGMTTAGLAEMGWKVAVDELAEKAATREPVAKPARRMRSATSGGV